MRATDQEIERFSRAESAIAKWQAITVGSYPYKEE
jgi:hypothetical protein